MAPRRSGRSNASAYKKGDYVEYQYKGSTVTGQLSKKSSKSSDGRPMWVVTPSDRRRKNEEIPEKALGKIINAQDAMNNRGPKLKKKGRELSQSSSNSNSDGSLEDQMPKRMSVNARASSREDNAKVGGVSAKKQKSIDSNGNSGIGRANKTRKTVTFSRGPSVAKKNTKKVKKAKATSRRIGTRSTRRSGDAVLLPELPVGRKKKMFKTKKIKKDDNVTVVKMLTGTLYLYRGDRPRAEFIRTK